MESMAVIVDLVLVSGVSVIVRAVFARMLMIVHQQVSMFVTMFVLVMMLVAVNVGMVVGMNFIVVSMFMRMGMLVFVSVKMLVFVIAFHVQLLSVTDISKVILLEG